MQLEAIIMLFWRLSLSVNSAFYLVIITALKNSIGSIASYYPSTLECMSGFSLTSVSHKTQAAETALFCPAIILYHHNFIEVNFPGESINIEEIL